MRIERIALRNIVLGQLFKMARQKRTTACPFVHRISLVGGKHESVVAEKRLKFAENSPCGCEPCN